LILDASTTKEASTSSLACIDSRYAPFGFKVQLKNSLFEVFSTLCVG